ncbi:hypothetical protein BZA05DRAFT_59024 [Tricharina praecox]|uniref:uncharacterized protein n=1 Tax=Tricharina praecox TaxID=43433 RepID=UPI00221F7EF0|nr:uncharacterized protein BZA05DRAFT_59024 [Tricharina praecox]KAI5850629.1 hypothetical protein BZA05DRAFT_59024 [Tricharina praecox]
MNTADSSAPASQGYTRTAQQQQQQQGLSGMPLGNGARGLSMSFSAAAAAANQQQQQQQQHQQQDQQQNGSDSTMMDQPLMISMGMAAAAAAAAAAATENGGMGSLDPQLSSVGDQFAALATTSPLTAMPNEFGGLGGGSTLTEFTKRRNWSQRILEELQDFLHVLTPTGKVVYASPSSRALTGFGVEELIGKFITDFIHEDDSALFVRDFNESIATGRPLRLFYRFRKSDDTYAIFEAHGHPHIADAPQIDPSSLQSICKGFFMMARPYPTRNAALLDSFLEHKIENERLMKRIVELRQEEYEDQQQQRQRQQNSLRSDGMTSTSVGSSFGGETPLSMSQGQTPSQSGVGADSMPPPAKPVSALTRQNLDRMEASNSIHIEGIRDKMARIDGPSHMDTIEILTGLRYREGERSKGISTGDTSPALIRGDVGVPIPVDKENRQSSDKKKKQKIADEYVCTDCGTLDSPEWRKGPKGPKTLCNACGLRWAKYVLLPRITSHNVEGLD